MAQFTIGGLVIQAIFVHAEDLALARDMKRARFGPLLADGRELVTTRTYASLTERMLNKRVLPVYKGDGDNSSGQYARYLDEILNDLTTRLLSDSQGRPFYRIDLESFKPLGHYVRGETLSTTVPRKTMLTGYGLRRSGSVTDERYALSS